MSAIAVPGAPSRRARRTLGPALAAGGLVLGLLAGELVASGRGAAVTGLGVVVLPVVLWRRPQLAPVTIIVAALCVEQFAAANAPGALAWEPPPAPTPLTAHVPLFHGMGSVHLAPADMLLFSVLVLYLLKTAAGRRAWPRSAVSRAVLALSAAVALGIGVGVAHGGDVRVSLMETRPFAYLAATYVLATVLATSRGAVRAVLWGIVGAVALKAVQGLVIFAQVRHWSPRPEAVLGHEEAFFFGLYVALVAALWLFDVRGPLRRVATWLLPLVLAGDLANNRRAAWLVLGGGLLALGAIGLRCLPARRHFLVRVSTAVLVALAVYLPVFWNGTGGLAQPARALHSMVSPNPRDASSDLYRVQEDENLKLNIHQGGLLGKGFGVPIDYALPITDISDIDPLIAYVPHDGVLYVLMRIGLLGGLAFWGLLGAAIISGCRLAHAADRELAAVGALLVAALIGYALMGAIDQAFFFYRIAFVVGTLLGIAEAARRIEARS